MTKAVKKASEVVDFLYAKGAIVNLGETPRYVEKVLTGRPSFDFLTDGGIPKGRLVLIAGEPSAGKCLGKGTEILMFNGEYKKVEDIVVGDLVMGVDSRPRMVCNLSRGEDDLYLIKQKRGADYVVNSNHTLTLVKVKEKKFSRYTNENGKRVYDYSKPLNEKIKELVQINIQDLIKEKEKAPVNFRRKFFGLKRPDLNYYRDHSLEIDPYLLGVWLGDGTSSKPEISCSSSEIIEYIEKFCKDNNFNLTTYEEEGSKRLNIVTDRGKDNPFLKALQLYNLINNKHIPLDYLTSSLEDRLQLLAGILDTDGYLNKMGYKQGFEITQKSEVFIKNIKQLAEGCGFICSEVSKETKGIKSTGFTGEYYRLYIKGNLGAIPNKVGHKKGSIRPTTDEDYMTSIDVEHIGVGEYYGFEVDGDAMFMLKGQTITHNSSLTIQIANLIGEKVLYVDTEATLTTDYLEALGADPNKFGHCIPETTEQMMNIIRKEVSNYNVIVIDSINNSASNEQLQKTADEKTMANRANVLASQLPILISLCNQYNTTLIVLSQIRDNMNKANMYSPDTIIPGGKSLHHNSSMTIELKPATKKKSKDSDELDLYETITGRMVRMTCTKNKVGKPFRTVELEFSYGRGYTIESDVASAALRLGVLEKAGSWVKYKGTSIAQGIDNVVPMLFDNPELLEDLKLEVEEKTKKTVE